MGILGSGIITDTVKAKILLSVFIDDLCLGSSYIYIGQSSTVCTHICDQTLFTIADIDTFIESLGNTHCTLGGESEFCGSFLL